MLYFSEENVSPFNRSILFTYISVHEPAVYFWNEIHKER